MAKKIYRTVFQFEVLSEEPIESMSLNDIAEATTDGHMSGRFLENSVNNQELTGLEAARAIEEQGSDTEFFGLDANGEELEEDY